MVKHATIRFAWHDSKWNGTVCRDPERNIYCTGCYSLLSPRVQRRIDFQKEQRYRGQKVSKIQKEETYIPPCYWCLNALGDSECVLEDYHPFADTERRFSPEFAKVPPLKYNLNKFCIFSWNFKLGYAGKGSYERYVPPEELNDRTKQYLNELEKGKSVVFFYANYSNPITADHYKYLLLGAGVVRDTKEPREYNVPERLVERIRSQPGRANMPKTAWQFQILLDPDTVFVLPYHEYLNLIDNEKDESASSELWKKLDEAAIRIEETTIIPNFKYVSMHLEHDKALFLLYLFRQSTRQMKNHNLIGYSLISEAEQKIDKLLASSWKQRGKYPGFRNALYVMLSHDFDKEYLKEIIPRVEKYINENYGSIEEFFEGLEEVKSSMPSDIVKTLRILKNNKDRLEFLSLFDFSITQFENIERLIDRFGFGTIKANPYIILENYQFDFQDSWDINECDYGVSIYQIDIALIPDPKYADWETTPYDARSPERLRALITKILYDSADQEGNSCLTREEILNRIQSYPLYYITEKLKVDQNLLLQYEKQQIFKEKFLIIENPQKNEVIYQLKRMREIEGIIEEFIGKMLKKTYSVDTKIIEDLISKELESFKDKLQFLDINERRNLYTNSLKKGLFVISGKAGSGKTQAIINLIAKFVEAKKSIFVFTPTGKANLVVRNRLKKLNLHKASNTRVSTIHRFLYRALSDYYMGFTTRRVEIARLGHLIEDLLEGKLEVLDEFRKLAKSWSFNPRVVIIDETSMVDEILLAVLFGMINPEALEHLILVGDERQLPPIGVGRPFVDLIFYLKQKGLETNLIHLKSNLRFDPSTSLGIFSDLFSGQEEPSPTEVEDALNRKDEFLERYYFSNSKELRNVIKQILAQIGCQNLSNSLFTMFTDVFESEDKLNLDKVQIITPRRIGDYGSMGINRNVVLEGTIQYAPNTKLICEENIYFNAKGSRVLGLANGSIGYIKSDGDVHFEDIDELIEDCGYENVQRLKYEVSSEVYSPLRTERKIDLGYAITVHKSQGSDFDHVVLVFSQVSPFITRELLYTAFTRPRTKLHFVVHDDLKKELPHVLIRAYNNSLVEQRKTLLFGHKASPFKPYRLTLKDKTILEVDSKIEWIIAKLLDEMNIKFEYGIEEFLASYHVKPDFKLHVNGKVYYIEHLGRMDNIGYRERWLKKFDIYKNQLGIADILITTSESEEITDVEENIKKMIEDIISDKLQKTEGFSYHHYEI
ncbi:MAG: ATP-dependent DNA helicase [Candidatus Bathyarchaeia archaeon]|jgi:exodeoxyribonuclease V alpha subunit